MQGVQKTPPLWGVHVINFVRIVKVKPACATCSVMTLREYNTNHNYIISDIYKYFPIIIIITFFSVKTHYLNADYLYLVCKVSTNFTYLTT
jgi:hypothetical protein